MLRFVLLGHAALLLCLPLIAAAQTDISKPPSHRSTTVRMKETLSVLSLPIRIPLSVIKTEAEKSLPDTLHNINERRKGPCVNFFVTEKCVEVDLKGWVKRNGPLVLTGSGAGMEFTLPLKAQITATGTGTVGKHIEETGQGAMTVFIKAAIGVTSKWQTRVTLTTDYQWDVPFYVEVAGVKISLQAQADQAVKQQLVKVQAKLKKQITEQINLYKIANDAWALLQKPLMIGVNNQIWIDNKPQNAFINYIGVRDNAFTIDAGVLTKTRARMDKMPTAIKTVPIPDITRPSKLKGLHLRMPLSLPYSLISARLLGPFTQGIMVDNQKLKVTDLNIYPHRNRLVFALTMAISEKPIGTVYLNAKLKLDLKAQEIRLSGLDYTQPNDHPFWQEKYQATRQQVLDIIKRSARYQYADDLLKAKAWARDQLGSQLANGVSLDATIESIEIQRMVLGDMGVVLDVGIDGAVVASLVLGG
ncbi:MAG: DUF4403 family protein [Algicola sp.]|nr:DUF4403 family protein [Algicola sp.]